MLLLKTKDDAVLAPLLAPTEDIPSFTLRQGLPARTTGSPDVVVVKSFAKSFQGSEGLSAVPAMLRTHTGQLYRRDRRLQMRDNTVEAPQENPGNIPGKIPGNPGKILENPRKSRKKLRISRILVKTGTVGTGTVGRRNRPKPNRTVDFLELAVWDTGTGTNLNQSKK